MPPQPEWLNPITELSSFNGEFSHYIDHLFRFFERDFIVTRPRYENKSITFDNRQSDGKPEGFWHITSSENPLSGKRNPELRRCERVEWVRAIIENSNEPQILVWKKPHKKEIRVCLFLRDFDFLVVLRELQYTFCLVTAIYIDYPNRKRKLLEEYEQYTRD